MISGFIVVYKTEAHGMSLENQYHGHVVKTVSDGEYYQQKVTEYLISCFLINFFFVFCSVEADIATIVQQGNVDLVSLESFDVTLLFSSQ